MRRLIPEVIQTSAMDCGPAALKAVLEGCGIPASYGRLREACQTEVDGTSIDTIEETAVKLGLEAQQVMVPLDHLFVPEARYLPAIAIVRQSNASHHFVVVWAQYGGWLQVMDPAVGRRWVRVSRFLEDVYQHRMAVAASAWEEWAASDDFLRILRVRLRRLGGGAQRLVEEMPEGEIARLDAAARMTNQLGATGAVRLGNEAARMAKLLARGTMPIPEEYWTAHPTGDGTGEVMLRGAVLVQIKGRRVISSEDRGSLGIELEAALREKPGRPGLELLRTLAQNGKASAAVVVFGLALAAVGSVVEAVLLRGLYDLARELTSTGQRAAALGATLGVLSALVALEFASALGVLRLGRQMELRLRLRFLHKIPRLADRYFRSRPISDMAERSQSAHYLRQAPELAAMFLRNSLEMAFTVAAIGWLYPSAFWQALLAAAAAIGVPLLGQPILKERDLKLRVHGGALSRFNLDALLGVTAIRAHGAARAVRSEHGALLGEWARVAFGLQRTVTWLEGVQLSLSLSMAAWVVWSGLTASSDIAGALLLVYWVLNLPALGQQAASAAWQYPMLRNTALRFLEPLGAPEEPVPVSKEAPAGGAAPVRLENVAVIAGGHRILEDVTLSIEAGEHVAIVGRSGAGKSSLVGLLLGWHTASEGRLTVDGKPLDATALDSLRAGTAWVDPQVQIWNQSLYENLLYGNDSAEALESVLEAAELKPVVERLPSGMQTALGEAGGLVSGGEGQRVRLGRAMARRNVRLVILDEPARGLDRTQRRRLIERARQRWKTATLICITHDVSDTLAFDRVLVIEDGRIAEDGAPARLSTDAGSRYRQLLDAEAMVNRGLWGNDCWRRFRLQGGELREIESKEMHAYPGR
jgi:ATP-binding cassette subfamily B protein